jgi:hypothetical protein
LYGIEKVVIATAVTWLVDKTANGGMSTIQQAVDAASAGDTVLVAAGSYTLPSGDSGKQLTFLGANAGINANDARGPETILDGGETGFFRFSSTGLVTFDGFTFTGARFDSYQTGNDIALLNNVFHDPNLGQVLFAANSDTVTFSGNLVTFVEPGIYDLMQLAGNWDGTTGTQVTIADNVVNDQSVGISDNSGFNLSSVTGTISGNTIDGISYYGLLLANDTDVVVSGNTFQNITNPDPTVLTWGAGVRTYTPGTLFNLELDGNTFINNAVGLGIRDGSPTSITATNNTFTDNQDDVVNRGNTVVTVTNADSSVTLYGGLANDDMAGTSGNDTLRGNDGSDRAVYTGTLAPDALVANGGSWTVNAGSEGVDTLISVEIVDGAGAGRFLLVGSGGFTTIQAALNAWVDGDTIRVAPGTYTGSAADFADLVAKTPGVLDAGFNATVTDVISVTAVNDLAAITPGIVTATLATGSLASFADLAETGNAYTINVNDAADALLAATALSSLGGKTTAVVSLTNPNVISGTAAEVTAALVTADTLVVASTAKVTITDTISVSDVNAIAAKTSGVVTATLATGSLASFADLAETGNAYTITVNDVADAALAATDLSSLGGKTTAGKTNAVVTVSNAAVISGTTAEVTAALVTADTLVVASTAKVTVTDTISVSDVNAIAAKTSGVVTATLTTGSLASFADLAETGNAYTITVNDASAAASELNTVDGKTTVVVNATAAATINGSIADVLDATDNQDTLDTANNVVLVLSAGTATAADLNTLNSRTTGLVNGTALTAISGSPTDFDSLLAAIAATQISVAAGFDVTVNGEPSIAQLTAIDALNGIGALSYTTVKDTAANLVSNAGGYITGSVAAVVTNTVTVAQMTTIDGYAASGGVSVANTGKISDTFNNLLNDRQLNGGLGKYVIDGPLVEVSVSVSGVTAANANVLAGVQNIDMASGATLSISDTSAQIIANQAQINSAFGLANVLYNVSGSVTSQELSDLSSVFGNASNVSLSLAQLPEFYSIADATWAAQHGFTSQVNVFTPDDAGLDQDTLQLIDVTVLNAALTPTAGTYSYEGLLKSLLAAGLPSAGWTKIEWLGSTANETLSLTGYSNSARSLKLDGGGGNDNLTGTTSADWILGGIGNDTLAGVGGNDSIEGGDGDDRLTGGAGQDTMDGGAGADTFVFSAGDSGTISGSLFDRITGFTVGTGGDRLDLVGNPPTIRANATGIDVSGATADVDVITGDVASGIITLGGANAGNIDSLNEWISVARTIVPTSGQVAAFQFGSDTYVYQENGTGDLLIKLTSLSGITSLSTSASSADTIWIS